MMISKLKVCRILVHSTHVCCIQPHTVKKRGKERESGMNLKLDTNTVVHVFFSHPGSPFPGPHFPPELFPSTLSCMRGRTTIGMQLMMKHIHSLYVQQRLAQRSTSHDVYNICRCTVPAVAESSFCH